MFKNRGRCVSWGCLEECALCMGLERGHVGGGTHDRRLGFVLKAAENTEECEVNDDMVENSVEQNVCLQAQIMKPFFCLELELNACFRALPEFGSSRSVHPQGMGLTTDDLLADPVFRQC